MTRETMAAELDAFSRLVEDRYAFPQRWPSHIGLLLPINHPEHRGVYDDIAMETDPELLALRWKFLADFERMQLGWSPKEAELATAPSIEPVGLWNSQRTLTIGLVGWARKQDGTLALRRTSMIVAWDRQQLLWIRTLSRFYVVEVGHRNHQ